MILVTFEAETHGCLNNEAIPVGRVLELVEHGARALGQSRSALTAKICQHVSLALQRALSRRECDYNDKLRVCDVLPAATCVDGVYVW
jgi:hypothetical protein